LPQIGIYFNGGLGDDIMRSAVARELKKRGARKIWQFTSVPELYAGNPDVIAVPDDFRLHRLCNFFRVPCIQLNYPERPPRHFIAIMCETAGIEGEVELRPYVFLTDQEKRAGKVVPRPQVAVQTSSLAANYPMRNKLWPHERFQTVADALKHDFDLIQIGASSDPELRGALDLRGKTSVRETAVILSASRLFVGLATGLVHLARAVECRSVVIYGGREDPSKSGYSANENLSWSGPCAPCWLRNDCDYDRVCMSEILPEQVIAAVRRQAERYGSPLPVDRLDLAAPSARAPVHAAQRAGR
jgi:ADP-heptose:LPS heptosyltransferase